MGGGGHNGDGRAVVLQKSGANAGSATNANAQYMDRCQTDPSGDPASPASVPEPLATFLLGLGIIGLAGAREDLPKKCANQLLHLFWIVLFCFLYVSHDGLNRFSYTAFNFRRKNGSKL